MVRGMGSRLGRGGWRGGCCLRGRRECVLGIRRGRRMLVLLRAWRGAEWRGLFLLGLRHRRRRCFEGVGWWFLRVGRARRRRRRMGCWRLRDRFRLWWLLLGRIGMWGRGEEVLRRRRARRWRRLRRRISRTGSRTRRIGSVASRTLRRGGWRLLLCGGRGRSCGRFLREGGISYGVVGGRVGSHANGSMVVEEGEGRTLEREGYGLFELLQLFGEGEVALRRGDAGSRHFYA